MNGVSGFVQPRMFYDHIIYTYWRLWLIAHESHDMLCIHAVRKIRKLRRSRAECRLKLEYEQKSLDIRSWNYVLPSSHRRR